MQQNDNQELPFKEITLANEVFMPELVKIMNEGHTVTISLRGFSMRPFLEDNRDKALLTKAHDLKVGDAVLAECAYHRYVLHRIIDISGEQITLRGDGNLSEEHCTKEDVKGSVIGFYRKGREKMDKTNGMKWKCYSFAWCRLYPIRRYLLAFYRRIWIPLFGVL